MRFLLLAATPIEIPEALKKNAHARAHFEELITGIGMTSTALALGARLSLKSYDGILNLGIAGSFTPEIKSGQVIRVIQDHFGDLGAEDNDKFIPIDQLGFGSSTFYERPFTFKSRTLDKLKKVSGVTVNTVHGNASSIRNFLDRLPVDVESMEGAAAFQAAEAFNVPCLQVRAVSNFIEPRNREKWGIPLALDHLNRWFEDFCEDLRAAEV